MSTISKIVCGIGIISIVSGIIVGIYSGMESNKNLEIAELKEAQYMQEHYGYKDNMDEYLEYLKVNDFKEYLTLKEVYDNLHTNDNIDIVNIPIVFVLGFGGLIIMLFGGFNE